MHVVTHGTTGGTIFIPCLAVSNRGICKEIDMLDRIPWLFKHWKERTVDFPDKYPPAINRGWLGNPTSCFLRTTIRGYPSLQKMYGYNTDSRQYVVRAWFLLQKTPQCRPSVAPVSTRIFFRFRRPLMTPVQGFLKFLSRGNWVPRLRIRRLGKVRRMVNIEEQGIKDDSNKDSTTRIDHFTSDAAMGSPWVRHGFCESGPHCVQQDTIREACGSGTFFSPWIRPGNSLFLNHHTLGFQRESYGLFLGGTKRWTVVDSKKGD